MSEEKKITWSDVNKRIADLPDGELKKQIVQLKKAYVDMAARPNYTSAKALDDFVHQLKIEHLDGPLYNADRNWIDIFDLSSPKMKSYEEIAEALGFENVDDLFNPNSGVLSNTMNAQELKAKLKRLDPDHTYGEMLSYLANGAAEHHRELYLEGYDDDGSLSPLRWAGSALMGVFTPRVKEAIKRGEDPSIKDYAGDILESATMSVPAGAFRGLGGKIIGSTVSKIAPKVASRAARIGQGMLKKPIIGGVTKKGTAIVDNAVSPAIAQAYDYMAYDDPTNWRSQEDGWDFARTGTATAINMLTPKMVRTMGSGIASKFTDAAGKADRELVNWMGNELASFGRNKESEIAEAAARRAGILKRVPQKADEITSADVRAWNGSASESLPDEGLYKATLTEQAASDAIDRADDNAIKAMMKESKPDMETKITLPIDELVKLPDGTVTSRGVLAQMATKEGSRVNSLAGQSLAKPTESEAVTAVRKAVIDNPDLQTKMARKAGLTSPKRDALNLMSGSYASNQIGSTMYANDVGGVQAQAKRTFGQSNEAKEQEKAKKEVLRSMRVPKSHYAIFVKNPKGYQNWRHGFGGKGLTPEQKKHLEATSMDLLYERD